MSVSVINGESQVMVPPGFRFHPTEEELLQYYLRKKVAVQKIDLDVIRDVDLNKLEPWDIQEKCKIGSTPQNDWYLFSHKDKKYPTGSRTNRATAAGFWKATGRDKVIQSSSCKRIGMRKTLVFYKGRAPHGQKSDWIMHEYRLLDDNTTHETAVGGVDDPAAGAEEDAYGWVVCRVFKKKNYLKVGDSSSISAGADSRSTINHYINNSSSCSSGHDEVLDQILAYMGRSCGKQEQEAKGRRSIIYNNQFMQLPRLESPPSTIQISPLSQLEYGRCFFSKQSSSSSSVDDPTNRNNSRPGACDWVALDRLVASQLNGALQLPEEETKQLANFHYGGGGEEEDDEIFSFSLDHHHPQLTNPCSHKSDPASDQNDLDFWNFDI